MNSLSVHEMGQVIFRRVPVDIRKVSNDSGPVRSVPVCRSQVELTLSAGVRSSFDRSTTPFLSNFEIPQHVNY